MMELFILNPPLAPRQLAPCDEEFYIRRIGNQDFQYFILSMRQNVDNRTYYKGEMISHVSQEIDFLWNQTKDD